MGINFKYYLKAFSFYELINGLIVTNKYLTARKITIKYPEQKTPLSPRFRGHHALRYEIDLFKCIYCGYCEEACPVDAIVETNIFEYHFEKQGENIQTKEKLLAIGDKYEAEIAKMKATDAPYR